jgi:hypothetical protein
VKTQEDHNRRVCWSLTAHVNTSFRRAQRGAAALRDAAAGFDVTSPHAEGWTDALEALRAKFKVCI